jgi:hypothetical protein
VPLSDRLEVFAARFLPFVRRKQRGNREAVLRLLPLRNSVIEWQENAQGEAELTIPYRKDRWARVVAFVVQLPEARKVQLDEVGTFVWNLCDGQHSVEAIVRAMIKEYKMNRAEVEASVARYLQMLAERRFVGFVERRVAQK